MIKIDEKRYHPDEIKIYYPYDDPSGNPGIVFQWRNKEPDTVVKFLTKEIRDMHINAMDEILLIIKDGIVVERPMDLSPFIFGDGPSEGGGGSILQ